MISTVCILETEACANTTRSLTWSCRVVWGALRMSDSASNHTTRLVRDQKDLMPRKRESWLLPNRMLIRCCFPSATLTRNYKSTCCCPRTGHGSNPNHQPRQHDLQREVLPGQLRCPMPGRVSTRQERARGSKGSLRSSRWEEVCGKPD